MQIVFECDVPCTPAAVICDKPMAIPNVVAWGHGMEGHTMVGAAEAKQYIFWQRYALNQYVCVYVLYGIE